MTPTKIQLEFSWVRCCIHVWLHAYNVQYGVVAIVIVVGGGGGGGGDGSGGCIVHIPTDRVLSVSRTAVCIYAVVCVCKCALLGTHSQSVSQLVHS